MITRRELRRPVLLTEDISAMARHLPVADGGRLTYRSAEGTETELPGALAEVLMQVVADIADHGEAEVRFMPDLVAGPLAARLLEVTRPELLTLVEEGQIEAVEKHGHAHFRRDDVFDLRERRVQAHRRTMAELREMDIADGLIE